MFTICNMRRFVIFLLLCASVSISQAQIVIDTLAYRFVYDVQAKIFEESSILSSDEHWLDIGKNGISSYYSRWKDEMSCIMDSLNRIGADFADVSRICHEQGIESSQFNYYVYKNDPTPGKQTIDFHSMECLQYEEAMGQDWEFVEGDTIILNHPCHKAVCQYHGRIWTSFYATDIPVSDGPWKLCGLPGLILSAIDNDGAFVFHCVGIKQCKGEPMMRKMGKRRKLSPEIAHKLIEQIDSDPFAYMRSQGHTVQSFDEKGRPLDLSKIPKRAYYESYSMEDRK